MRETVGETNLTVVTMILIGVILAVFYFIIPRILKNVKMNACCTSNNGRVEGNSCVMKALVRKTGDDSYQQIETWKKLANKEI